jgi:hypothetical protein
MNGIPAGIAVQQAFGIGMIAGEPAAFDVEFRAQLVVIVDFAIKDQANTAMYDRGKCTTGSTTRSNQANLTS